MNNTTMLRIAMCIAGTIRVGLDYDTIEIPLKSGMNEYKFETKFPSKSKGELNTIIKDNGGRKFDIEDGNVKFEVPSDQSKGCEDQIIKWIRNNKKHAESLNFKKILRYKSKVKSENSNPEIKSNKKAVKPPPPKPLIDSYSDYKKKDHDVVDERQLKKKTKSPKVEKSIDTDVKKKPEVESKPKQSKSKADVEETKSDSKGFKVEIPLNPRGLVKRLHGNPHIKSIIEEYGGHTMKGDGLSLSFPDRKKRSEILDEITDAISGSGFLREILDLSEV